MSLVLRSGFGLTKESAEDVDRDYASSLVESVKRLGGELTSGRICLRLATVFGFCYGVDRAIDYAYQARRKFPNRRILITHELIHNPEVNRNLAKLGIRFLASGDRIEPADVVIVPAFGADLALFQHLRNECCTIVDTTCGSVLNVWKQVEKLARDGYAVIMHGKPDHEETRATCSYVMASEQGRYLVIRGMEEAAIVARVIEHSDFAPTASRLLVGRTSDPFDFGRDLDRVGMANQTTMLTSESLAIAKRLRRAFLSRYGEEEASERFRSFDTICSATQDRQDAVNELLDAGLDLLLVVGGFNSSNTSHLAEIGRTRLRAYHIEGAEDLNRETIHHRPPGREPVTESGWLPQGKIRVGLTGGASTPSGTIGRVIAALFAAAGEELPAEGSVT